MLQILQTVEWELGYKMEVMHLSKQKFTAADLQQAIVNLPTNEKDIVVIYYAGYGLPPSNKKEFLPTGNYETILQMGYR
jgi:hypothetical protein